MYGYGLNIQFWNFETDEEEYFYTWSHHDVEYNYKDETFLVLQSFGYEVNNITYVFDFINEYNEDGGLVWMKDTRLFIDKSQWCPFEDSIYELRDITHSNSIFYDEEESMIYLNSRNVNTFYKISFS